ncbi:alpha/beta hydrolase [Sphaerisporangium album]|uniref:Alpha/beta hydrolase n=1 Tax=Sphaerisporangium album TaxID=509200 RepID=A0A367FKJ0_9ACTN|nr:alpha/beta hydrolase fold domain-containing protein [Sphaerisporangium album]RCG30814.1 alpha/beta hydrolase [Sphaerisporangium album]
MERTLIWIHGGAWMRRHASERSREIFSAHGLHVVTATHRLSDEATWPAQLDDVREAAREARAERPDAPLLVGGRSSGGHLALQLGLHGVDAADDVAGVIAVSPPVDPLAADWPEARASGSPWTRLLGHVPTPLDDATADATPANHIGNGVPVLLVHGADDATVPPTQALDLANALLASGHPVTTYLTSGDHDLDLERDDVRQVIAAFLAGPALCRAQTPEP